MARGGARKGAGRPKGERQGVAVSFWVSKETQARLRELRERGFNTVKALESCVYVWHKAIVEDEKEEGKF